MEEEEIFVDIPDYVGMYQISNLGNVKSLKRLVRHYSGSLRINESRILKFKLVGIGYYAVSLAKNGKNKQFKINVLMGICFKNYDPKNKLNLVVDHKDNNKLNNNLDNLQIITQRLNCSKDKKPKSGYTGVQKRGNSFQAKMVIDGKTTALGTFNNPQAAHNAYLDKLKEIAI